MRQNIRKVLDAFASGKPAKGDSKVTCWTDGQTIFSYALPIARRVPNKAGARERIEILADWSTMTTRAQISAIRSRYPDAAIVDDEIPHPIAICGVCTYGHGSPGDLCERHGKRIPTPAEQNHRDERIAR